MLDKFKDKAVVVTIAMVAFFSFIFGQNFEHKQIFKDYELFYIDESTRQYIVDESFDGDCITLYDTKSGELFNTCDGE